LNFGGSFGAERKVQVCAQIHQGCSIPHAVAEALPATGRFMAMCFDPSGASVQGLLRVVRDSRNWNVFFLSGPLYVIGRINNFEGLGRIFTDLHPSSPRLQGQQVFNGRILCSHHGPRSSLRLSQRHECLKEAQAPNATESKIRTTTSCKNGTCVLSFPAQPTKLGSGLVCQGLLQVVNCKSLRAGMLRKVPLAFCASPTLACWPFVHLRGFEMPPRLLPRLADTDNGSISQISQSSILSSSGLSTKRPSSQ
jgi:hypothetical protein